MASPPYTRDDLLGELRAVAKRLDVTTVPRSAFMRETGINEWQVTRHFDTWNDFVSAAGLDPDTSNARIGDDDLMRALAEAYRETGGLVSRPKLRRACRYSPETYQKRYGKWDNVLARLRVWVEEHDAAFPYLSELPTPHLPIAEADSGPVLREERSYPTWESSGGGQRLGPFLNFRGLQHAPINEQGVVLLFGMVAFDLGYVVEGVGTGFPDCDAKRSVDADGKVWERVRVEFEYRSRNFRDHGHQPAGCDLIICWEHNWPECPVEVLELRSAIEELGDA